MSGPPWATSGGGGGCRFCLDATDAGDLTGVLFAFVLTVSEIRTFLAGCFAEFFLFAKEFRSIECLLYLLLQLWLILIEWHLYVLLAQFQIQLVSQLLQLIPRVGVVFSLLDPGAFRWSAPQSFFQANRGLKMSNIESRWEFDRRLLRIAVTGYCLSWPQSEPVLWRNG